MAKQSKPTPAETAFDKRLEELGITVPPGFQSPASTEVNEPTITVGKIAEMKNLGGVPGNNEEGLGDDNINYP